MSVSSRTRAVVQIVVLFVFPIALIASGVVPVSQRFWVLLAVVAVVASIVVRDPLLWSAMGVRTGNLRSAVVPYTALAIVGVVVVVVVAAFAGRSPRMNWWASPHFWGIFFIISAAQEFLYRGFLISKLKDIVRSSILVIVVDATLFALLHVIFPDPALVLPMSFLAGLALAALWLRWPNLLLASVAHAVLNVSFVMYCFGSFATSCMVVK